MINGASPTYQVVFIPTYPTNGLRRQDFHGSPVFHSGRSSVSVPRNRPTLRCNHHRRGVVFLKPRLLCFFLTIEVTHQGTNRLLIQGGLPRPAIRFFRRLSIQRGRRGTPIHLRLPTSGLGRENRFLLASNLTPVSSPRALQFKRYGTIVAHQRSYHHRLISLSIILRRL